ncbi:MAG: hypothetical protein A3B25_03785 [Candidatus Ryanbacteria bacterium RIFCSPLOWO2_01_FULL_48_26]|uniref:Baseplate protein J-like domain-containing protein n=1 Tax=Candidatus Ryanbacteria bacterium RIFCSPLOWO2_01_FULL_48_26 TaxID=1802126 RepID=A0A1G2GT74_9BACT|nr:MAG: hypothetical protein A3B25_03785 [Candidatus Ryanbacteria bacterium RIFCSPLOWO2_01_FULL_48_26]
MKKIFVRRDESVAELVEKIISAEEEDIVLVIPNASGIGRAVSSFDLIKRESEAAGKKIFVESVDEKILALAKSLRIEALHPLFEAGRKSVLSDIVQVKAANPAVFPEKRVSKKLRKQKEEEVSLNIESEEESGAPKLHVRTAEVRRVVESPEETSDSSDGRGGIRRKFMFVLVLLGFIFLVGGGIWVVNRFFGTSSIAIHFKKAPWTHEHAFLVDTSAKSASFANYVLPGQFFNEEQNFVNTAHASGLKNVSERAIGVITIYNAYSSAPQQLVATTRFETPDGKIFRLSQQAIVPGAKIQNGKIIPSSIEAAIVADAPGSAYNLGPIPRLTIPGFKGSPKYSSFYGEIVKPTKGGFVGQKAVPTAADIQAAKDKTASILKTSLEFKLNSDITSDFKQFDSVREFRITKLSVNESTDENGNFSVLGEAKISTIGFREADIREFLKSIAIAGDTTLTLEDLMIEYRVTKADVPGGKLSFSTVASGTVTTDFSSDGFREELAGRTIEEARFRVSKLPGLSDAKISVWPIWLRHVPSDVKRIKISVD